MRVFGLFSLTQEAVIGAELQPFHPFPRPFDQPKARFIS